MKKKTLPVTNLGTITLLMVFVVLCMITFAALSLSGAVSDYHISQNIARHNTEYYTADGMAAARLQEIDTALRRAYTSQPTEYFTAAAAQLELLSDLQVDFTSTEPTVAYQVPINNSHALSVKLILNQPDSFLDGYYHICLWQEISTTDWNGNDKLNLMK